MICEGDPYTDNGAQRRLGAEDFLSVGLARRRGDRFPFSLSTNLFGGQRTFKGEKEISKTTLNLVAMTPLVLNYSKSHRSTENRYSH
jgi:hypothetical protein